MPSPYSHLLRSYGVSANRSYLRILCGDGDVNFVDYAACGRLAVGCLGVCSGSDVDYSLEAINDHGQLVINVQNLSFLTAVIVVYTLGGLVGGLTDVGTFLYPNEIAFLICFQLLYALISDPGSLNSLVPGEALCAFFTKFGRLGSQAGYLLVHDLIDSCESSSPEYAAIGGILGGRCDDDCCRETLVSNAYGVDLFINFFSDSNLDILYELIISLSDDIWAQSRNLVK